jgi:transcriptional regulator with XRE-family HTH domain
MTCGNTIKSRRITNGLSLSKLARLVGCSAPYIVEIEKSISHPSPEMTAKLSRALSIDPDDLVQQIFREKMMAYKNIVINTYDGAHEI